MEKSEFYNIVEKMILPLFTGSFLAGETESSSRDLEVALGKSNSILLKPSKLDEYRLILKRGQAFKTFEVEIIRLIIDEIAALSQMQIEDKVYLNILRRAALEKALISSITESAAQTILNIIYGLEKWGARTYEGETVKMGVLVNLSANADPNNAVNFSNAVKQDFFALFTDGISSFVEFDKNENLLGYVNLKNPKVVPTIAPHGFEKIARYCNDKRVGIVLTERGDILIFYARQLLLAKRSGYWSIYAHDEVIRLLSNNASYTAKQIRRSIYNTALDCSFAHKGACIAYINKEKTLGALAHIDAADIISEKHFEMKKKLELEDAEKLYNMSNAKAIVEKFSLSYDEFLTKNNYTKTMSIRKIVAGKKLFELDRKLVEEMTSIDGATVVDHDGTIIAVGCIVKIEAGSKGGGRLAATSTLAKYGVAIKVSQDGVLEGYSADKANRVKQIFNVG